MEILTNPSIFIDQQVDLLFTFYQSFKGNTIDYNNKNVYRDILLTKVPQRTIYCVVEDNHVLVVAVVDFEGSPFFSTDDNYNIDLIAFNDVTATLLLIDHLRYILSSPIKIFKTTDLHMPLTKELKERATWTMLTSYQFNIRNRKGGTVSIPDEMEYILTEAGIRLKSLSSDKIDNLVGIINALLIDYSEVIIDQSLTFTTINDLQVSFDLTSRVYQILESHFGPATNIRMIYILSKLSEFIS